MKKAETLGKLLAVLFLIVVAYMTIEYFLTNWQSLNTEYRAVLIITSTANLILLLKIAIQDSYSPKRMSWFTVFFLMVIFSVAKSLCPRVVPGAEIHDFTYYLSFNESWSWLLKFFWHLGLDAIVLGVTLLLKKSPLLLSEFFSKH